MLIKVVEIKWISETAKEAEVIIFNGKSKITCFSQPLNYLIDDVLTQPIYCFDAQCIFKSTKEGFSIEKQGHLFEYFLKGKLINLQDKLVDVEGFFISLEDTNLPGDLIEGDTIEFTATRLDIY